MPDTTVKPLNLVSLTAASLDFADTVRVAAGERTGRVFALDVSGEQPADPWATWVAEASARTLLETGSDVAADRGGPVLGVVRLSGSSDGSPTQRRAFERAAVEAQRGTLGAAALERVRSGVITNLLVVDTDTTPEDLDRGVDYLLDPELNGYTVGATVRLTGDGGTAGRGTGRVLITGGAGTIGSATAEAFAAAGYEPILSDVDAERLEERAASLGVRALALDVTDASSLQEVIDSGALGTSLAAVALVHGFQGSAPLDSLDRSTVDSSMRVNGTSVATMIEALRPLLREGAPSSIVVVSSQCGIRAEPVTAAYCAPKFGVVGLVEGLAPVLAREGISVHTLCPGPVDTAFLRAYFDRFAATEGGASTDDVVAERSAAMPVGRFAQPREMGEALRFLAQLDATGVVLAPTGGETLT